MRFLRSVWEDIQQGESLDLYITVAISLILGVLNVLGKAPQSLIAPLNLAILALLAIAMLGNRHRLERVLLNVSKGTGELFYKHFTEEQQDELRSRIEQSTDLLAIGSNLELTLHVHLPLFEQILRRGDATIRIVLVNPNSPACDMTVERQARLFDLELQRAKIRSALNALGNLQAQTSGKLEVRLIDYPLSRGGIIVDPDTHNGALYLWNYGFKADAAISPKFVLHPADGHWYDYFRKEASAIWDNAITWQREKV